VTVERYAIGPAGTDTARVSVYTPTPGAAVWDQAHWDQAPWGEPAWQRIECQVTDALYRWGASTAAGFLTRAEAGEIDVGLYDPGRLLDPLNAGSPIFGAARPGTPIKIEAVNIYGTATVAAYGFIERATHDVAARTGRLRAVDGIGVLAQTMFPGGTGTQPLPDTLRARTREVVSRSGAAGLVLVQSEQDLELAAWPDPAVAPRDPNAESEPAWSIIAQAAEDALSYVWVDPTGLLRFRYMETLPGPTAGLGCGESVAAVYEFDNEAYAEDTGASGEHNGAYFGAPGFTGGGVWLNGGTKYVEIPSHQAFDFTSDFVIEAELEQFGAGTIVSKGNWGWGLTTVGGRVGLVWQFREDIVRAPDPWPSGRHSVRAELRAGIGRIYIDGGLVAENRWQTGHVGTNPFPVTIGCATAGDWSKTEFIDAIIYRVSVDGPPWLNGLGNLQTRQDAEGIINYARAQDAAGAWQPASTSGASQDLYGIRPYEAARAVPGPIGWGDRIVSDRAMASAEVDVLEVRPADDADLSAILEINRQGAQLVSILDDEHGTPIRVTTRIFGGELGVEPIGWRALWASSLPAGEVPTRRLAEIVADRAQEVDTDGPS
jgi:hypothetical protein